jgi:alkylation response protein AidB-like acyl-CoA dehydrogenase
MRFAFTDAQETIRREARTAVTTWSSDELSELSFLEQAVVYEEAGRAGVGESFAESSRGEQERLAAAALEAVGIAEHVLELAVAYVRARHQFGRPIGSFQAVSHPLADTYVATELARSLAYWAAWCVAEDDPQTAIALAAAKSFATEVAVAACERSIQVHGGIGFTWEHELRRYYERALELQSVGGYGGRQREQIAAWLLDGEPEWTA